LLFHSGIGTGMFGLRLLPLRSGPPRTISSDRVQATHYRVSPDAAWVALAGDYSGRREIYVQNFPTPTARWQISTGGGVQPVWRSNGKEVFYIAADGKLMTAPITLGQTAVPGTAVPLFETHMEGGGRSNAGIWHQYDVSPDGKRFLVNTLVNAESEVALTASRSITVVSNWASGQTKQ
jgi:Tol biopolymer transport system component